MSNNSNNNNPMNPKVSINATKDKYDSISSFDWYQTEMQLNWSRLVYFEDYIKDELKDHKVIKSIFCGGLAGMVAKSCIAPAERVKMSFQISTEKFTLYKAYQRFLSIIKHEGILGLWKGHSTTLIRVIPYAGLSYAFHDLAEDSLKQYFQVNTLSTSLKFIAGSFGGISGTLFTYPLDVLRVRLALTPNSTWKSAIAQGGLYQGFTPTLIGIVPYSGFSWMMKQTLLELYPTVLGNSHPTIFESFIMNALSG